MNLILDIKIYIASIDEITWYNLYRVDNEFRQYAKTEEGCARFIDLATIDEYECDEDGYHHISKKIFKIVHYRHINDLPARIYYDGAQEWWKNGKIERDNDLPAYVRADVSIWYKNGKKHRDGDLPAVVHVDGTQYWYKNGKKHIDGDLPTLVDISGTMEWYKNGKCHRDNDLPAIIYADGTKYWYKNGKEHREHDLPACIHADGTQHWYKDGKRYYL